MIESKNLAAGAPGTISERELWKTTVPEGSLQTTYWFRSSKVEDLVIGCGPFFDRCMGNLDFKDLGLEAKLIFNKDAVYQHAVIVDGLRTLLKRWQTNGEVPH
ncbi:hypothetical protein [Rhizobium rhizogenes]|uniref:hypothetical protein n=1 Tax=Rhizobium rhizogenes TaxID=359 RepID=UPI0015737160|nr:hypothetical protein [Rhizobium rhizogenes]NTF46140.1 hypothetical protein [Rhizobium rhizogenes]